MKISNLFSFLFYSSLFFFLLCFCLLLLLPLILLLLLLLSSPSPSPSSSVWKSNIYFHPTPKQKCYYCGYGSFNNRKPWNKYLKIITFYFSSAPFHPLVSILYQVENAVQLSCPDFPYKLNSWYTVPTKEQAAEMLWSFHMRPQTQNHRSGCPIL